MSQAQICTICKTGKEMFVLDKNAEMCPYVWGYKDGKCPFFVPLADSSEDTCLQDTISPSKEN